MLEVTPRYTGHLNAEDYPNRTVKNKSTPSCNLCGKEAVAVNEYIHPFYKCTMIQWMCPRCRHKWNEKKIGV